MIIIPVLLQAMSFSVIYSGYLFNKSYISANLCENRSVPEKHCEGKCLLKKEMKAESEKENSAPASVKKGSEVVYLFTEILSIPEATFANNLLFREYTENYHLSFSFGIFHPPCA